jgi:tricorn protease
MSIGHLLRRRCLLLTGVLFALMPLAFSESTEPAQGANPDATMLQYPDVGKERIVFVYANDVWTVDRDGGVATPLASPDGREQFPRFSPDGESIAFMGNYDGDTDLYSIPVAGGLPFRITHHPGGEDLCDWTPDGRLLFSAGGVSGLGPMPKLYQVSASGGLPEALPVPYGAAGAISPDGKWLAYTPYNRDGRSWKRYRGGMASDIWLFHLETSESRRVTDWEGTDTRPMWNGDALYYLSDRGEKSKLNIWLFNPKSGEHRQVTRFSEFDVKWPSIGPGARGQGEIVFQNGPSLYLLDLLSGVSRVVTVTIPGATPKLRRKSVDAADYMQAWGISSTGKRAVAQARGDIWTLPAEKGAPRNLTRTDGVAERYPAWSPDGRWIAYFSDATGEYELYITQSDGKGETKKLTSDSAIFYVGITWAPDSKSLLFEDKASQVYLHTIDTGETRKIDRDPVGQSMRPRWSHDSRWITYSKLGAERQLSTIWLYEIETDEKHQVTSGMFADRSPVFDRHGDYLYFASSRSFAATYSDVDSTWIYKDSEVLMAVPLLEEIDSPWLSESDEEEWKEEGEEEEEEEAGDDEEAEEDNEAETEDEGADEPAKPADDISGTWEGVASTPDGETPFSMTLELGAGGNVTGSLSYEMFSGDIAGSYDASSHTLSLTVTIADGMVIEFELEVEDGTFSGSGSAEGMDIPVTASRVSTGSEEGASEEETKDKKGKARETVEIDLDGFERRAVMLPLARGNYGGLAVNDKNQLLYYRAGAGIKLFDIDDEKKEEKTVSASGRSFQISGDGKKLLLGSGGSASIQGSGAGGSGKKVVTSPMTVSIDPRVEWRQLFMDTWRLYRDYFYLENMHGVDWLGVRERYQKMLVSCVTREDVSFVIREMIAELNVGHAYYGGGDGESAPRVSVGLLGVDWELDQGAYRIARIHEGGLWDTDARNPLNKAGLGVEEGDYLLAVNGVPVDTSQDPWAAFVGLAGKTIPITVSEKPTLDDDAREVVLETLRSERRLRYRAWVEANRKYVDEKTNGMVGYIYVPDTGVNGQTELVRQYVGQLSKKALIIDERWNGGGQLPTRFIELLNRPITSYWAQRDGIDMKWPQDAHHGPKCMLINGLAGSGGDMFPYLFRQAGIGKLVGTRTWGGLVGLSGNPGLIDGGRPSVPTFGIYEIDGTWGVEGHGVDPDIEVIDDPALMVDGGDPQLDAGIELMLEEIEKNPFIETKRPVSPDRSGMGITEEDK